MEDPTKVIVSHVRVLIGRLAKVINRITRGKIKPAQITTLSLLGHFPAAWALYTSRPILGALLIASFGILDSFDGALAREQKTVSKLGMFYDATTDRIKEILIYSALAVYLSNHFVEGGPWLAVAVAGTSLLVSYTKAKGEMAVSDKSHDKQELNRAFGNGIARYEIRMILLIIGLITGYLAPVLRLIIALNLLTTAIRFLEIARLLKKEEATSASSNINQKLK
jgi:phosphatidylglycerophosphate synthase